MDSSNPHRQPVTLAGIDADLADAAAQAAEAATAYKEAESRWLDADHRRSRLEVLRRNLARHLGVQEE